MRDQKEKFARTGVTKALVDLGSASIAYTATLLLTATQNVMFTSELPRLISFLDKLLMDKRGGISSLMIDKYIRSSDIQPKNKNNKFPYNVRSLITNRNRQLYTQNG